MAENTERLKNGVALLSWRILSDQSFLRLRYISMHRRIPNLDTPRSLTEKLTASKKLESTQLMRLFADKYTARAEVASRVGEKYLIPLLDVYECAASFERISQLNPPFILKASHGSGWNIIVRKSKESDAMEAVKDSCRKWLTWRYNIRGREDQYRTKTPLVLAERMLVDERGNVPADYKFYCFGKAGEKKILCQVDLDRFSGHKRVFYNENWSRAETHILSKKAEAADCEVECPECLEEMLSVARELSKDFSFCRVDLYEVGGRVYFGEVTFHPESGYGMDIHPKQDDWLLGALLPTYDRLFDC